MATVVNKLRYKIKNIMRIPVILFFLLLFSSHNIHTQAKVIRGKVYDTSGAPMIAANVCQKGVSNCTLTDINGEFELALEEQDSVFLRVNYTAFKASKIYIPPGLDSRVNILMDIDTFWDPYDEKIFYRDIYFDSKMSVSYHFGMDFSKTNFDEYASSLGDRTTLLLNRSKSIFYGGVGFQYNNWRFAANIGITPSCDKNKTDSLKLESLNYFFGINAGYAIIDNKRLLLYPKAGIKYYQYDYHSSYRENTIPLDQYLAARDIELKFGQPLSYVGLDLAFKFYPMKDNNFSYWTIGFYGNYLFKLKEKPFLHSKRNTLISDATIDYERLNWGVKASFTFGFRKPND